MIKNIENKIIEIKLDKEKIIFPKNIEEDINNHWKKVIKENPTLWNGEVAYVSKYAENDEILEIICKKTNYSHYLYAERVKLHEKYNCPNLSAGCLLETSDGYLVIGELEKNTSYPGMLQISGGNVDNVDIIDDKIDIYKTISREVLEELNIDLYNKNQVNDLKIKYMHVEGKFGIQILAKGVLNMSAKEMEEYYSKYLSYLYKNNLEVEFGKIHFIKKDNAIEILNKMENPKRNYLMPFILEECKYHKLT